MGWVHRLHVFSLLLPSAYSCALLDIQHKALCILLQALYVKYKYNIHHLIVQGKQFEIDANTVNHKWMVFLMFFHLKENLCFFFLHMFHISK
jgi:hypothetical protein